MKRRGFKTFQEYFNFLAQQRGFKNYNDYAMWRYRRLREKRILRGDCSYCGRDKEILTKKMCEYCLKKSIIKNSLYRKQNKKRIQIYQKNYMSFYYPRNKEKKWGIKLYENRSGIDKPSASSIQDTSR